MGGIERVLSRKALTSAADPAAWRALAAERIWRLRAPCAPVEEAASLHGVIPEVHWPTEYEWPLAARFVGPIRAGLSTLTTVVPRAISQPYEGIVLFDICYPAETLSIAVDYHDLPAVNPECVSQVALYFKMQHLRSGYEDSKILPGGYIASRESLYEHYCRLRELRERGPRSDVYGRFGTRFSAEIRRHAIDILQHQTQFKFTGGTSLALYVQSLREAAQARVCIDMPGNGSFCYRLVEYLAIGCCIVAPRHTSIMCPELRDREHIVYCRDDLADFAELCAHYVENDRARETVSANAARFFDQNLHPRQLAAYYLRSVQERLGAHFKVAESG
jgi:Glycosyl transferases group 1